MKSNHEQEFLLLTWLPAVDVVLLNILRTIIEKNQISTGTGVMIAIIYVVLIQTLVREVIKNIRKDMK